MNGMQATIVGRLAVAQRVDVDVQITELEDEKVRVQFIDHFSTDEFVLDKHGEVLDKEIGYRT